MRDENRLTKTIAKIPTNPINNHVVGIVVPATGRATICLDTIVNTGVVPSDVEPVRELPTACQV